MSIAQKPQLRQEVALWITVVWRHYKVNISGGALIVILFLWQTTGKRVPWWVYAAIAVGTLFISAFLGWRDEHREADRLRQLLLEEYVVLVAGHHQSNTVWNLAHEREIASKISGDAVLIQQAIEQVKAAGLSVVGPMKQAPRFGASGGR